MNSIGETLQSGNAALFLLIRKMTTDKVAAVLKATGGTVLRNSFDETKQDVLQAALANVQDAATHAPPPPPDDCERRQRAGKVSGDNQS